MNYVVSKWTKFPGKAASPFLTVLKQELGDCVGSMRFPALGRSWDTMTYRFLHR